MRRTMTISRQRSPPDNPPLARVRPGRAKPDRLALTAHASIRREVLSVPLLATVVKLPLFGVLGRMRSAEVAELAGGRAGAVGALRADVSDGCVSWNRQCQKRQRALCSTTRRCTRHLRYAGLSSRPAKVGRMAHSFPRSTAGSWRPCAFE